MRRTAGSLVGAGHRVVVFEMLAAEEAEQDLIDGIEIRRVPVPMRYEGEDMAELRPLFDLRVVGEVPESEWYHFPEEHRAMVPKPGDRARLE